MKMGKLGKFIGFCFALFVMLLFRVRVNAAESYTLTLKPPSGYTQPLISVDGREYSAVDNGNGTFTIKLTDSTAKTAVMYKLNANGAPVGMYVWGLTFNGCNVIATPLPFFEDILSYHGFSIRIKGVSGIRFKSGISVDTRNKLTSSAGYNGYHLVEYGTLYMTMQNRVNYPFIHGGEKVGNGRAYWRENGKLNDKVLETVNGRYRFASVLINLPVKQYNTELAFRSYMILNDGKEDIIIYGPAVGKSMAELANQINDMNMYKDGTSADLFVKKLIADSTTEVKSKKGIQGAAHLYVELLRRNRKDYDWNSLGVNYVLFNLDLTSAFLPDDDTIEYVYNGKTYTFSHHLDDQKWMVQGLHEHGVESTMVLLLSYDSRVPNLTYTGSKGTCTYHAWNLNNSDSREKLEAVLSYLFEKGYPEVDHWVLGNEVNMPYNYNYTGNKDLNSNVSIYADEFIFTYNIMKKYNSDARLYFSLDRNWASAGDGIAANKFLPSLINAINAKQSGIIWNVAEHPYPPDMFGYNLFAGSVTHSWDSPYLCATNIDVLTDWIKNNYGTNHRVILSEVGFHNANEQAQAAAMAYTYYVAQFNNMVDQVIFRSYADTPADGGLNLGFLNAKLTDGEGLVSARARLCYSVFEYMDTATSLNYTEKYLSSIGLKSWISAVPKFNPYIFSKLR